MDTKRNEPATQQAPYLGDTNTDEIFRTRISAERRGFVFIRGNPR